MGVTAVTLTLILGLKLLKWPLNPVIEKQTPNYRYKMCYLEYEAPLWGFRVGIQDIDLQIFV